MSNDNDNITRSKKEFSKVMTKAYRLGLVRGFLIGVALFALVYWLS